MQFSIAHQLAAGILVAAAGSTFAAEVQVVFVRDGIPQRVLRTVPAGAMPLETAVRASADGPTPDEAALGIRSYLPAGTTIASLEITSDKVVIDFSSEVLQELDEELLESIGWQFSATIGDFNEIRTIHLNCQGRALAGYLPPTPVIQPAPQQTVRALSSAALRQLGAANSPAPDGANALAGRKVTIGPSHGRYYHSDYGWLWQRTDPCGFGESVLEDTNSIRMMQFLAQYLSQDGALVTVPRDMNESDCCHSPTGLPWWKMAARYWLQHQGLSSSIWDSSDTDYNDDIRARPLYSDYVASDIYIAHHTNAGGGTGTETYRYDGMDHPAHEANSVTLANNVNSSIVNAIREMVDSGWTNRGVKNKNFGEIRIPDRPAILIELAFHDHCTLDGPYLRDNYFRSVAQWGIYRGVCQYFGVTPGWDRYSDEYVSDTVPSVMLAGQTYNVSVTFRNRGVVWRNDKNFRLGAVGDSDPFTSFNRVNISGEVLPGREYTFNFQMKAPAAGTYTTDWRMVRDGVAWFGPTLTKTVDVSPNVPDDQPPSTPADLAAVATGAVTVQLNWTASTDNVAVAGYDIRRDGAILGSSASNSYTDETASPNTTHTYEVRAKDLTPNYSNWSNSAVVTTPGTAPGDFIIESRSGGLNFSKYEEIGTFGNTSAKSTAAGLTSGIGGRYGSANIGAAGLKRALFKYNVPIAGVYEAFVTSGSQSSRNTNVKTVITHALGSTVTSFDEVANTNVWKSLGQFNLNVGTNTATVELNNENGNAAGANMNVDSVKYVFVSYLPVPAPPVVADQTISLGASATLSASVPPGQTVDWYTGSCSGTLLQAGTTSITVTPASTTTYYARGRNPSSGIVGAACAPVTVTVVSPPVVTGITPENPTACEGDSVTFAVTVSGTGPFTYQWKRGDTNVGATSPSLNVPSVTQADAGTYTCFVTGPGGGQPAASPGSTLTVGTCRTPLQWRSVRIHAGEGELSIPLEASASGNGADGPSVEPRSGGILAIDIDFEGPVTAPSLAGVSVTGRTTAGGVLQNEVAYTPAALTAIDADTLRIAFSAGQLPDRTCYRIALGPGTIAQSLRGDTDVHVRALLGDADMDGVVTASDMADVKSHLGDPATTAPHRDLNLGGGAVNLGDVLYVRWILMQAPVTPEVLCP